MTTPDQIERMDVCDSGMGTLERMKRWKVVDESTLPPDTELMILSGFLNRSLRMDKYITQGTSG
jgi:hypothetical protein